MSEHDVLHYVIQNTVELNLSWLPFISGGGLFIPSNEIFFLGDRVEVDLQLPGKNDSIRIEGKVVWITPKNALHHVLPGIGIQFIGPNAETIREKILASLDATVEKGGYVYGTFGDMTEEKKGR